MQILGTVRTTSPDQTVALGAALARLLAPGDLIALVGGLGAGKTCFASGVVDGLGIPASQFCGSPTFTLVNEYEGRIPLYHIDLYRLQAPEDLEDVGLDHYLRGEGACLIEWFDRFPDELPAERLTVLFTHDSPEQRTITVLGLGTRAVALGQRWIAAVGQR